MNVLRTLIKVVARNIELERELIRLENYNQNLWAKINKLQSQITELHSNSFEVYGETPEEIIEEVEVELPISVRRVLEENGINLKEEVKRIYGTEDGNEDYAEDYILD